MGKALITALLIGLLSAPVVADTLVSPNRNGGEIVLTAKPCKDAKNLYVGYSYGESGQTLWFCWTLQDDNVIAVYNDGSTYTYKAERFFRKQSGTRGSGV